MATPTPMARTVDDELVQAQAKLWCDGFGYLKSAALRCAVELGIPNAIHRLGGVASLSELHAAVPVATSKRPCLSRLLRFLATSGILMEETPADDGGAGPYYRQTAASRLLVEDGEEDLHHRCLSPLVLMISSAPFFSASQSLADWLQKEDDGHGVGETPFTVAHGEDLYGFLGRDASPSSFSACFNKGMESDSDFLADAVVRECTQVLAGVKSLVDVGGGNGAMARAIAKALPHVRCSVLELSYLVEATPADDSAVEFVVGDMMDFIPPADVVFIKSVLLNWSDEECIRILKQAKEAISTGETKGKVIIVDFVMGYPPNKEASEAQVSLDLKMMVATTGKLRGEETWQRIFLAAGFTHYKIVPGLGLRSLIVVYP